MKNILTSFLLFLFLAAGFQEAQAKVCRETDGTVVGGVLTFPEGVCTALADTVFSGRNDIFSAVIPDGVTSIGWRTFENCTSLASIDLPDSLTRIGGFTFVGCTSLASIDLPDSLTTIEKNIFENCTSLASIDLPDSLTSIGDMAFKGLKNPSSVIVNAGSSPHNLLKDDFYSKPYADSYTTLVVNVLPTNTPTPTSDPLDPTPLPTATPEPGTASAADVIRVVPLPEDEYGSYELDPVTGEKNYLLFHTYDICMDFLNNDALCSGYERCYHK